MTVAELIAKLRDLPQELGLGPLAGTTVVKRSRLEPLLDLSPVEVLGLLLVAMGVLCLLALTCTGCGGSPFGVGLEVPDASPPAVSPPVGSLGPNPSHPIEDSGREQWVSEGEAPGVEAGVPEAVPVSDAPVPDAPVPDAAADRPEEQPAPEASAPPDAAPEAAPPPLDPACLRCSVTCGSSQLSYTCAGGPFSCGHTPAQVGDPACSVAGACAVGGPCGLPGTACWGGTVVFERGPSCP